NDLLSRLGRAAWDTLENWVGSQSLQLVAESLSTTLWLLASGISVALTTICGILGDLLVATNITGGPLVQTAALGPGEVQRVLLWALAAAVGSWALGRLWGLLVPALHWVKLCCFLAAFLHVAIAPHEPPTTKAAMLLGLWLLYALLGRLVAPPATSTPLDTALRDLEWKVEELRRRQK
ncbi:TM109 protein, partial [Rhinopomastus cyanomelas]|nr:TM109 protein [Rhinopomastus cyanomelas]